MAEDDLYSAALRKAMAICAVRECCRSDVRRKLESWDVQNSDIERIIVRLINEKFIDEERFAAAFVKDKFKYNRWGKIKISAGLRQKEIPETIINTALRSIDDEAYKDLLKTLLSSHRKTIRAKNQFDLKGKLLRYGLSKGFESHLLYDLLNAVD